MTEYTHPIVIKGNYQIVAVTEDAQYDPADVASYAVQTMAGARLRKDLSLEDARIWVDRLIEEDDLQRTRAPVRTRPMRQRR